MFFSDYKNHPVFEIRPHLLWEYDLTKFDYQDLRNVVVQRVVERGCITDFYAILNLYGEDGVVQAIKEIAYFNDIDMNFVAKVFGIPFEELKSYHKKQLPDRNWNS